MSNAQSAPQKESYSELLKAARAFESQGDCETALQKIEEALKADHENPAAYLQAAEMIRRHDGIWKDGKQIMPVDRAARYLTDGLSWSHDNLELMGQLYHAQCAAGQLHRAVQTAAKLVTLAADKDHWRKEGAKVLESLDQSPQLALFRMTVSPVKEAEMRQLFSDQENTMNPSIVENLVSEPEKWERVQIKTVADYLKLTGMRVQFSTKADDFLVGDVVDLSDSCTQVILKNVILLAKKGGKETKFERKALTLSEIIFAEVIKR